MWHCGPTSYEIPHLKVKKLLTFPLKKKRDYYFFPHKKEVILYAERLNRTMEYTIVWFLDSCKLDCLI